MPIFQMFCLLKNFQVPIRTKICSDSPSNSGSWETKSNHQGLLCWKKKKIPYWNTPTSYWKISSWKAMRHRDSLLCLRNSCKCLIIAHYKFLKSNRQNSSLSLSSFSALHNRSRLIHMSNFMFTGTVFLRNFFIIKPISQIEKQTVSGS